MFENLGSFKIFDEKIFSLEPEISSKLRWRTGDDSFTMLYLFYFILTAVFPFRTVLIAAYIRREWWKLGAASAQLVVVDALYIPRAAVETLRVRRLVV